MKYYKLMTSNEDGCAYEYVSAKDRVELESKKQSFISDFPGKSLEDITLFEVTVEECLKEEEERIEHQIFNYYFKCNYNPDQVTVREYANMKKKFKTDLDFRWQVLREFNAK